MTHIIGVDIETTSTNSEGRLIQIGMATMRGNEPVVFAQDVIYQLTEAGSFEIQAEALEVNGFTLDRIFGSKEKFPYVTRNPHTVAEAACVWLKDMFPLPENHIAELRAQHEAESSSEKQDASRPKPLAWYINQAYRKRFIALGWNVGSFDLPFIHRDLPQLGQYMHYRTIDLNAVCFAAAEVTGDSYEYVKEEAKEYAAGNFQSDATWHDAGYDAATSLLSYEYLIEKMSQLPDA